MVYKVLLAIYRMWFFIALFSVAAAYWFLHASGFIFLIPFGLIILMYTVSTVKCFSFFRPALWPLIREDILNKLPNPLVSYPVLIWMAFEGKKIYVEEGFQPFIAALKGYCDNTIKAIQENLKQLSLSEKEKNG